jgi:hypothetical protein
VSVPRLAPLASLEMFPQLTAGIFKGSRIETDPKAPFLFIHGDADGVRLDHISEMFRLKGGGEIFGDMRPRWESRLAVLPNTTRITLMGNGNAIIPMVNDILDAKSQKK